MTNPKLEKEIQEHRKKFGELLSQVKYPRAGKWYEIEVAEVLAVGRYMYGDPEVAVVKDATGKPWAVPEDRNYDKPGNRLVSRWNVHKGMKLRVRVSRRTDLGLKEKEITEVVVIKR